VVVPYTFNIEDVDVVQSTPQDSEIELKLLDVPYLHEFENNGAFMEAIADIDDFSLFLSPVIKSVVNF